MGGFRVESQDDVEHFAVRCALGNLRTQRKTVAIAVGTYGSGSADNYLTSSVGSTWNMAKAEIGNVKENIQGVDSSGTEIKQVTEMLLTPVIGQNMLVVGFEFNTSTVLKNKPYDLNVLDHRGGVIYTIQHSDVWDVNPQPEGNPKFTVSTVNGKLKIMLATYIPMGIESGIKIKIRFKEAISITHNKQPTPEPIYKLLYNEIHVEGVRTFKKENLPFTLLKDGVYNIDNQKGQDTETLIPHKYNGSMFEVYDAQGVMSPKGACTLKFVRETETTEDTVLFKIEEPGASFSFERIPTAFSYEWWYTNHALNISAKLM